LTFQVLALPISSSGLYKPPKCGEI